MINETDAVSDRLVQPSSTAAAAVATFPESIRLVIWDLDETFWKGTLTESEVVWIAEHENIVKALAARGILSSVCSKNDFGQAMGVLKARNLDSYFIFPSIDWSPKGKRIKAIVDNAQLRPETVLFIDDHPLNRAEVLHANPGINVVSELFITEMLSHRQLEGKDDRDLTRLAQYKSLEMRKLATSTADENGDDFLRESGVKVFIDYDLEGNIERCIELINRTNQLNFTKCRLSADAQQAQQEFLGLIRQPRIQGGLIHCRDKYGDHGYVGLYIIEEGQVLRHFLFSCRILGMGVEQWLYQRLGNPYLAIAEQVLSDPRDRSKHVDWIELVADRDHASSPAQLFSLSKKIDHFYVLGGCVMENIGHYLRVFSENVVHEGNVRRDGIDIRRTHTAFLAYEGWLNNQDFVDAVEKLGCVRADFQNRIFHANERSAVVLSFWYDQICVLYRHKHLPIELPFSIDGPSWDADLTKFAFQDLPVEFRNAKDAESIFRHFKDNFVYNGFIRPDSYKERVSFILDKIHPDAPIFILDIPSQNGDKSGERQVQSDMLEPIKNVHRELARDRKNIYVVDPLEFVMQSSERLDWWHFDRKVYYRIYKRIMALIASIEN